MGQRVVYTIACRPYPEKAIGGIFKDNALVKTFAKEFDADGMFWMDKRDAEDALLAVDPGIRGNFKVYQATLCIHEDVPQMPW